MGGVDTLTCKQNWHSECASRIVDTSSLQKVSRAGTSSKTKARGDLRNNYNDNDAADPFDDDDHHHDDDDDDGDDDDGGGSGDGGGGDDDYGDQRDDDDDDDDNFNRHNNDNRKNANVTLLLHVVDLQ